MAQRAIQPVMNIAVRQPRMTRDEFLTWVEAQPIRYEFDGFEPVAMVGSSVNHNRIVRNIHASLRTRLRGSGCEPFGPDDGLPTIGDIIRYPDAFISCTKVHGESRVVEGAVIVFEVLSPGNSATDRIIKVREYLAVASVHTYVIVEQNFIGATLLQRHDDTWTATTLTVDDTLRLHRPDIEIAMSELYEGVDLPSAETSRAPAQES
jgi:Uma2 family endonuclease